MPQSLKSLFLILALTILIGMGWYFAVYRPDWVKLQAFKEESKKLLVQLQSFKVTDAQISALQAQVEKIQDEILTTRSKLIPKENLSQAVNELRNCGSRFGLKFNQVIPEYKSLIKLPDVEQTPSEIINLPVHVKLQGYYKNFGRFVEALRELPFYVSVGEVIIVYNEAIHPRVEILVDMILFLTDRTETQTKS
ncbi:MAG: type 4a pilus biogenesis protein PilO [bacterium]